jgi:hypothetical protein
MAMSMNDDMALCIKARMPGIKPNMTEHHER